MVHWNSEHTEETVNNLLGLNSKLSMLEEMLAMDNQESSVLHPTYFMSTSGPTASRHSEIEPCSGQSTPLLCVVKN